MRRWLVLFLLAILPLQFSWAAVAGYCQHEKVTTQMTHFGHHEHDHESAAASHDHGAQPGKKAALTLDEDCSYCHQGCSQPVPMQECSGLVLLGTPLVPVLTALHDSFIPPVPVRPDRRLA